MRDWVGKRPVDDMFGGASGHGSAPGDHIPSLFVVLQSLQFAFSCVFLLCRLYSVGVGSAAVRPVLNLLLLSCCPFFKQALLSSNHGFFVALL